MEHYRYGLSINAAPARGDFEVLFSGEADVVGGHYIGPAVHDYFLIHVVTEGEGTFETLGQKYRLGAGDAFLIFPDILVKYEANRERPWTYMWIGFSGEQSEKALARIGLTPEKAVIRGLSPQRMRDMFKSIREGLDGGATQELGSLAAAGWLRLVLHEMGVAALSGDPQSEGVTESVDANKDPVFMKLPSKADGRPMSRPAGEDSLPGRQQQIDQAIRMLSYQYGQQISIGAIAQKLGYHRAHLTKLFKESTGLSPMQYLNKIRMKKAEKLLAGDLTIAQVAASVGFNDPLFFTKQFRKWSGLSPTEYRKSLEERGGRA
ncbi:AraC family transcriptional regulator [Paenibacillus sp. LHD-117]|uniref:AraC family transcriptional regulator n=1 Tax=Paenibacillus sp. LHD-117 TaxID=3071412 RepID=UPI0027E09F45|nr:AraC family transcriptional regulator [Paenibacillus sp. LHD-117]MDQ6421791.1 AraC family transcriptional regulator [Paenibacillus sp. LHD-117]